MFILKTIMTTIPPIIQTLNKSIEEASKYTLPDLKTSINQSLTSIQNSEKAIVLDTLELLSLESFEQYLTPFSEPQQKTILIQLNTLLNKFNSRKEVMKEDEYESRTATLQEKLDNLKKNKYISYQKTITKQLNKLNSHLSKWNKNFGFNQIELKQISELIHYLNHNIHLDMQEFHKALATLKNLSFEETLSIMNPNDFSSESLAIPYNRSTQNTDNSDSDGYNSYYTDYSSHYSDRSYDGGSDSETNDWASFYEYQREH